MLWSESSSDGGGDDKILRLEVRPFRLQAWQIGMIVSISTLHLCAPSLWIEDLPVFNMLDGHIKRRVCIPPALLRGNLCRHPLHTVILPCNIMMLNSAAGAGNIDGGVSICGEGCPSAANGVDKDGGRRIPGMH